MKNRERNVYQEAEATSPQSAAVETQSSEAAASVSENFTLIFARNHPQNRSSYRIPGVKGLVGIQREMVFGTTPFTSNTDLAGMPATITVNVRLADPKASNVEDKAAAVAAKAQEKADKAAAKLVAQQAKIEERAAKAKATLEAAQAKVEAAKAAAAAPAKVEGVEQL